MPTDNTRGTVLVLGATGNQGGAVTASCFTAAGPYARRRMIPGRRKP